MYNEEFYGNANGKVSINTILYQQQHHRQEIHCHITWSKYKIYEIIREYCFEVLREC